MTLSFGQWTARANKAAQVNIRIPTISSMGFAACPISPVLPNLTYAAGLLLLRPLLCRRRDGTGVESDASAFAREEV